jgi:hypothetical protein
MRQTFGLQHENNGMPVPRAGALGWYDTGLSACKQWSPRARRQTEWSARLETKNLTLAFDRIQPGWHPPETEWRRLKQASHGNSLELTVIGYNSDRRVQARGSARFWICPDAVTAPLFYRDVNLPFIEAVKDPSKIRWHFGTLDTGKPAPVGWCSVPKSILTTRSCTWPG